MSMQLFSLEGKRALVTGASRGLGRAMAEALATAGADVVCAATRKGGATETVAAIRQLGREGWEVSGDLSEHSAVETLAADAEKAAGSIDILVNNAGTIRRSPAAEYSLA